MKRSRTEPWRSFEEILCGMLFTVPTQDYFALLGAMLVLIEEQEEDSETVRRENGSPDIGAF